MFGYVFLQSFFLACRMCFTLNILYMYWLLMSQLIVFYLWMVFPTIGHFAILHQRQQVLLRIGTLGFCISEILVCVDYIYGSLFILIRLMQYYLLLYFICRGSLFSIFTTLIYHKVLINNKTEQDTEQDKQTKILVEQFTYILTQYIYKQYCNEQCMMKTRENI